MNNYVFLPNNQFFENLFIVLILCSLRPELYVLLLLVVLVLQKKYFQWQMWHESSFFVQFAGKALTFIKEKVLTWESGMRRGVPKVLVVVTDGRSQDEVKKAAAIIQHSGKHPVERS